ncbi:MAG: VWA domain-containing protein, partial [Gammaproteobacteria bacterium]|nr:VWA domain-containing protein [Gammaproteobacteria bacterium]
MLIDFFFTLRRHQVPVTIRELLDLVEGLKHRLVYSDVDEFYQVARAIMVKDEKHYDKFDQAFGVYFKGLEDLQGLLESLIPDEFLRREFERSLTAEELEKIESMGGLEKLIEEFRKAKEAAEKGGEGEGEGEEPGEGGKGEQEGQGGQGPNGSGGRGGKGKKKKGKKAWDRRAYKNLDDSVELGTRNIKLALRRLRKLARTGKEEELDMDGTIRSTAHNGGLLDIRLQAERKNTVKVLCFFDVGGSMDAHVKICEELFSAARTEFKHMEYFY